MADGGRLFFEVFPTIKVNKDLELLFAKTIVKKVTTSSEGDRLCVCILSDHLIDYTAVKKMSEIIKHTLFADRNMAVNILQRYELPDNYDLPAVMSVYRDSILEEIKDKDHLIAIAFKNAEISFRDGKIMHLVIPDTRTNRSSEDKLISMLEKILTERCGVDCIIEIEYKEDDKISKHKAADEAKLARKIAQIAAQAHIATVYSDNADTEEEVVTSESESEEEPIEEAAVTASAVTTSDKASSDKKSYDKDSSSDKHDYKRRALKRSDYPGLIYGKEFAGDAIPMSDIVGEIGDVIIRGEVISTEAREIRNERTIYFFDVSDYTDTFRLKVFIHNDQVAEISSELKVGAFIKVSGSAQYDSYEKELTIGQITGIMQIPSFKVSREDNAIEKRVELHCHTKMSDMDGVSDVKDIINRAYKWGHPAIAITDHGVAQAFPDAWHTWEALWKKEKEKRIAAGDEHPTPDDFFKIIYGLEAYLVDDLKSVVTESKGQKLTDTAVVFDIETTGFSNVKDAIIEIGAVKVSGGEIVGRFSEFINPKRLIPYEITELTSITDAMVADADPIETVLPRFMAFCAGSYLVAHNASFDTSFIKENCRRLDLPYDYTHVDTVEYARVMLPHLPNYKLQTVAKDLDVSLENHHRAVDDAECTAEIYLKLIAMSASMGHESLTQINEITGDRVSKVKKAHSYHAVMLALNDAGRVNMYRMISESHLSYMNRGKPCIPKSLLNECREGILLGSACEAGELYGALVEGRSDDEIARIVDYYDYLEIQPVGNNRFMIDSDRHPDINSEDDIREINKTVVKLGERFNKPVVATCDVHFLDPEDEIYRRIIMTGNGFKDADSQAPLYLHTTDEMLEEFMYLGPDKAKEIVIDNPVKIASMVKQISPVRPDKCPPVIENSDETLKRICYAKAHSMYGDPLPKVVQDRLDRELNSIISNGYAVMYIIAQKLVWKSMEDGYLVGSRGSVGSSFAATMAGITEVNPLSPHYYCSECHYSDFDSPEVKEYAGRAGVDMPDKVCPNCGAPLKKDGFDIPFETFLGFKGDKEPDIDLNFSSEYQAKAHKYVEVIFGAEQAYRAGTIGTMAEKTAYGYVKKYYEERGMHKRSCEIDRILKGCVGVRRSTGQHPGGIIVLPVGEEIHSFTPIQHPPKDETTITTHFDYHAIDHNLLKLDILGHEDPTMIRKLQDLTGRDPLTIPLDDPDVMSLFKGTEVLGITPEDIGGTKLGCLGIPEFGTDFAIGMLLDTKPQSFSDLVRIAGLAHGTDVWQNNAEVLIKEGTATISTAICTRDDIMLYLIDKGVEPSHSFKIMENVRKGNVAKGKCDMWPEWKQEMIDNGVPDWYIWSCERIKYMFPKAHAAAYVMMAWRVAYCKINYPLEYYAAFFSIRAKAFSYESMCQGPEHLAMRMKEVKARLDSKTAAKKDEDTYRDMRIVQEMYARGFEFMPLDIFRAKARDFQVIDGKIMPSFTSIEGLGETVADQMEETLKDCHEILSKQDFRERTKANQTIVNTMGDLGLLGELPESNQISIFDFVN
ncbi:MAG: PolC-type DNA polymerase III [Lachnospiraceae bacterium]|nr:PolC-type DNA polymerase III [Lachnospiraceae bacterium]